MKKTEQMISEFLEQIEKDKLLAAEKLNAMEEQKCILDRERSEISKAVIRLENEEDKEAVDKLTKELSKRVNEISVLDSKIEAYKEMGNNYEAEAEKIFAFASKEFNEEYPKALDKANGELTKSREEVENARILLRNREEELRVTEQKVSTVRTTMSYIINDLLNQVLKYAPHEIKELEAPLPTGHYETITDEKDNYSTSRQVYTTDNENYGYGMEGKLNYYYKNVLSGIEKKDIPKKKTLVDKILGR